MTGIDPRNDLTLCFRTYNMNGIGRNIDALGYPCGGRFSIKSELT